MDEVQQKWDRIYAKKSADYAPFPCDALTLHDYLLPATGKALDVACGLGGNALFLAERGLHTTAADISSVALEKVSQRQHPLIETLCTDIDAESFTSSVYDVIVVSNYLDRSICAEIAHALLPGGLLFYQTFVLNKVTPEFGPGNPDYLLKPNELLSLFEGLEVIVFSDLGVVGDTTRGLRNQSYLVAQRSVI